MAPRAKKRVHRRWETRIEKSGSLFYNADVPLSPPGRNGPRGEKVKIPLRADGTGEVFSAKRLRESAAMMTGNL